MPLWLRTRGGTAVAMAGLAFNIRKAPSTDRRDITGWIADTVGWAVSCASDALPARGGIRVGLRVSPIEARERLSSNVD